MKIEKLRSGNYRIQKMINGKRHSITFDHNPTKKEIDKELAKLYEIAETQNLAPKDDFNACAVNYIKSKQNILSVTTISSYESIMRNMPDWFKQYKVREITQIIVQQVVNEYSANHSPKSVRNFHGFIASVLGMFNPQLVLKTTLPMKVEKNDYIPTKEDIEKILEEVDGTRYYVPLKLACYGLRRSEVLGLTYPDDFNGNMVQIHTARVMDKDNNMIDKSTKTTKSAREIYIDDDLLGRIKAQGYIYNGYPGKINQHLQKVQERLDIPKFTLHKMRHYFASEMSRVLPEADWLALGGWSSPSIAKSVYRHNRIEHDNEMKKLASKSLFGE